MNIRAESEKDRDAVHGVNTAAFESSAEAELVDALRKKVEPLVSLVAEFEDRVMGHIMFSPVFLPGHPDFRMMGLAPMAVIPEYQRQGFGSALVLAGLQRCRELNCSAVVVLGHPEFYPRFGFSPSTRFGIDSEYDVPDEVFMVMELRQDALKGKTGRVKYNAVFGAL